MRQPEERRADLRAQLAANRSGALRLAELAERLGAERLREATDAVLDYSERRTRACLAALPDGVRSARTCSRRPRATSCCACARRCDGERLMLDFTGSAAAARGQPQLPARGHELGLPVRGARADRPGHPADRGRLPPDRGARAGGHAC